jgi:hypothetical protein
LFACLAVTAATIAGCTGDDDDGDDDHQPTFRTVTVQPATPFPGRDQQATLRGTLTLDGVPLDADFLGARVVRDGLVAACQDEIPSVTGGQYEITVAADAEVRGCGADGAQVLLWAFVDDTYLFSTATAPWPGAGRAATFDASFSSADPAGASTAVTELKGHLLDRASAELPGGTVVEAYVGDTRCGVTSLRHGDATEGYYTLIVAGPESVPECDAGAELQFRLDGQPAAETATNDLGSGANGKELDLTLR